MIRRCMLVSFPRPLPARPAGVTPVYHTKSRFVIPEDDATNRLPADRMEVSELAGVWPAWMQRARNNHESQTSTDRSADRGGCPGGHLVDRRTILRRSDDKKRRFSDERENPQERCGMARDPVGGAISRGAEERHGTRLHRPILQ